MTDPIVQPTAQDTPNPVRVFSMPARYRHGAAVNTVEPHKASSTGTTPVQPPVAPKVLAPIPSAPPKKTSTTSHTKKGLLIAGMIVLIAFGIGGYLLLRSTQKNKESVAIERTPQTTLPEISATTSGQAQGQPLQTPVQTSPATSPFPSAVTSGTDTDSDGLTDVEETIVYGTNPNLPDSDADGFLDGNEVFHGYNPNGTAPGTLVLAGLAQTYRIDGFQLMYPSKWTALPTETGTGSIISTSTGESVTVIVIAKDASLSLADWYATSGKSGVPSSAKSKKGFKCLRKKISSAYTSILERML